MTELPRPSQLEQLQRLCALTGQRYSRPRTAAQATARIKDLMIRHRGVVRQEGRALPTPGTDRQLQRLLRALKRECYGQARPDRIRRLEERIDRLMEAAPG